MELQRVLLLITDLMNDIIRQGVEDEEYQDIFIRRCNQIDTMIHMLGGSR